MKILAKYNGKKCYIFSTYEFEKQNVCACVFADGSVDIVPTSEITIIDSNYKIME